MGRGGLPFVDEPIQEAHSAVREDRPFILRVAVSGCGHDCPQQSVGYLRISPKYSFHDTSPFIVVSFEYGNRGKTKCSVCDGRHWSGPKFELNTPPPYDQHYRKCQGLKLPVS